MGVVIRVGAMFAVWVAATGSGWQASRASVHQPADIECPITIPPRSGFSPPTPYPETAPFEGHEWYGSDELWTALAVDGKFVPTKVPLWWSVNFPGGSDEPKPDVRVSWTRLGTDEATTLVDPAEWTTNGYTPETGWLMMAGAYPRRGTGEDSGLDVGCWKVQATYKGATLRYVIELSEPADDS